LRGNPVLEVTLFNAAQHEQLPLSGERLVLGGRGGIPLHDDGSESLHAVLEPVPGEVERVRITNLGQTLVLKGGKRILAGVSRELRVPTQFCIGRTTVFVLPQDTAMPHDAALLPFPRLGGDPLLFASTIKSLGSTPPSSRTLACWFAALSRLQRSPAGSFEFFQAAARAMFDPGGLDAGMILLRDEGDWRIAASYLSHVDPAVAFRRSLLDRIVAERQTLFHDARLIAEGEFDRCSSFVAAAPIVSDARAVAGVVYGVRFDYDNNHRRGIRPLETHFVQAVADAVAAGLERREREMEVIRLRSRLELAFSPSVARELEHNPKLLEGDEREVTILFCDLRSFTSLSERLSPRESYALLSDVMDRLTHEVTRLDGVVIDYFGDGLAAFWNAPLRQPNHPYLACQTAFAMLDALPDLSDDWCAISGRQLRLGVGIHTGKALVGNAGSRSRIKYGPRGGAMNLASRIERLTKDMGVPILISEPTARQLQGRVAVRRVARTKIAGFADPVDLFQPLTRPQAEAWKPHESIFEDALSAFDRRRFEQSARLVEQLQAGGVADPVVDHLAHALASQYAAAH
jgi:adenylate cyclase